MKALSIKQPWAWLICKGFKDVENRTWRIGRNPRHGPYSTRDVDNFSITLPERVYVHAGKTSEVETIGAGCLTERWILERLNEANKAAYLNATYFKGGIIGEVDIIACVHESTYENRSWWFEGPYGFVLANGILYATPIPCRGQLGFFTPDIPAEARK